MPNIKFGNIDFSGDGAYIWGTGQYSAPSRSVDFIDVIGRNGDLIVDNGKYNNTKARFQVIVTGNVEENTERLKYLLYSQKGYQRLYDSDMKGFYRMACYVNGFEVPSKNGGVIELEFDCKPLRYDINGDNVVSFNPNATMDFYLQNPYFEDSRPLITFYGNGGVSVRINGSYDVRVDNVEGNLTIDSEARIAYKKNEYGKIVQVFGAVDNTDISLLGKSSENNGLNWFSVASYEIDRIDIVPRWVKL